MTKVCFDYDSIVYNIGFSAEKRYVEVELKETKPSSNKLRHNLPVRFDNRTEFKEWCKVNDFDYEIFIINDIQEPLPVHIAKQLLNQKINNILRQLNVSEYYGYLSNGKVFREDVSTIYKYKGDRAKSLKPLHYDFLREELIKHHDAILALPTLEADDMCSIDSHSAWGKEKLIVVTGDKDAKTVEKSYLFDPETMIVPQKIIGIGKLYWKEHTKTPTLTGHGRLWFYAMLLLGDGVDCIKPRLLCNVKFGDVGCYKLLSDCKTDKEALSKVVAKNKEWKRK